MSLSKNENDINIPLFGGLSFPFRQIVAHAKDFFMLAGMVSFISALVSFAFGRSFVCGFSNESGGTFCSVDAVSFLCSIVLKLALLAYFINRWFMISFENKTFFETVRIKFNKKDAQTAGFILLYFFLWTIFGLAAYLLSVKTPSYNWVNEAGFFVVMSLSMVISIVLLLASVLFVRFLQGKNWMTLKQILWPIFDNFYKMAIWFLFFLVLFMFFERFSFLYFGVTSGLPLWFKNVCGELFFNFGIYLFAAMFLSCLQFQAKYLFKES